MATTRSRKPAGWSACVTPRRCAPNGRLAAGHSSLDGNGGDGDGVTLWRAGVSHRANDSLRLGLGFDRDRLAISPRSLSLGLTRDGALGQLHWTPDMNWTGDLQLRRDHYSDSNNSSDWYATLRRAVVRQPGFSLDLGGGVAAPVPRP